MLERNVIAQNVIFLHDFEKKNLNTHVRSQHELGNVMLMLKKGVKLNLKEESLLCYQCD